MWAVFSKIPIRTRLVFVAIALAVASLWGLMLWVVLTDYQRF